MRPLYGGEPPLRLLHIVSIIHLPLGWTSYSRTASSFTHSRLLVLLLQRWSRYSMQVTPFVNLQCRLKFPIVTRTLPRDTWSGCEARFLQETNEISSAHIANIPPASLSHKCSLCGPGDCDLAYLRSGDLQHGLTLSHGTEFARVFDQCHVSPSSV